MITSTGNPAIQKVEQYLGHGDWADHVAAPKTMTYSGAIINTSILLGLSVGTAAALWSFLGVDMWAPMLFGGMIVGFILALVIVFKPQASPFLAPIYAIAQGGFIAGASIFWASWAGSAQASGDGGVASQLDTSLIAQAAGLTFAIAAVMLAAYAARIIRATPMVVRMIVVATGGVILFMLANILMSVFMGKGLVSWDGGPLSIAISALIVGIAAFNLVIDFKIVEDGVANKAPKWMEWYAGFALLVTIVWLYVSILRLLAMLRGGE